MIVDADTIGGFPTPEIEYNEDLGHSEEWSRTGQTAKWMAARLRTREGRSDFQ